MIEERGARFCNRCGYQNPAGVGQCLNCTAALGTSCPNCQQSVAAGSKFCSHCGTRLAEQADPPASQVRAAPSRSLETNLPTALAEKISQASLKAEGERREVTILFLNVANFTAASNQLDSEEVYFFIDEVMSLLVEVIYQYEGTIDKFTGDGLMALFGAPEAHENDPERAVRAALAALAAIEPLQARFKASHSLDVQIRIGINTGEVIAGRLGNADHMEYTAIGDTVNLASRLETAATPGTVLVSAETYQRTRPLIDYETVAPLTLKGFSEPVPAYRPLGLRSEPEPIRGLAEARGPMIGRTRELIRLKEGLATVRERGDCRVALVTGEAGVGKTTLVAEFRRNLDGKAVRVYEGNCLTYARSRPLWVIAELLRDLAGLPAQVPAAEQVSGLQNYLNKLGLAVDELLPYLLSVLELAQVDAETEARLALLDAEMLQKQIHAALRQVILAEAEPGPLVLIFEDLHWVDPASRDFLIYLLKSTPDSPLLLILISRLFERETVIRPILAVIEQTPQRLIDLPLEPLTSEAGQSLVARLVSSSSVELEPLKARIVSRAAGNPFFMEEMVRALIDQGGLVQTADGSGWAPTEQVANLLNRVPGTLKGLILARFDRLPEQVRWTLQQASVLGITFPLTLLEQLNALTAQTRSAHLNLLESRRFIVPRSFLAEAGYAFNHELTQETIYSTLLRRDRRKIHTQVATVIEESALWSEEVRTEMLAYHYAESETPARAIDYLLPVADHAARRCAYELAIGHYRRLLDLLPAEPEAAGDAFFQARLGLGRSLKFVGQYSEAGEILDEVLTYLRQPRWQREEAVLQPILIETLHQLADVWQRSGNYDEAIQYLDTGLQLVQDGSGRQRPQLWVLLVERLAWIHFRRGRLERAAALARTIIEEMEGAEWDDPITLAKLYNTLGGIAWQQGERTDAIRYVERSLTLHEEIGYLWGVATANGNLGILYDVQGAWEQAADYHRRAQQLQQTMGDVEGQARSNDNLGLLYLVMGQHELAEQALCQGLAIRKRLGDAWGIAQSHINLAHLALVRGDNQEAADHLAAIRDQVERIGSGEIAVPARWIEALVLAAEDNLEGALETAEAGLTLARESGLKEGEVDILRVLGMVHCQAGRYEQAEQQLRRSGELALQLQTRYRYALSLYELGRLYQARAVATGDVGAGGRISEAVTTWQAAREIFAQLGAEHDLTLVQTTLGDLPTEEPE